MEQLPSFAGIAIVLTTLLCIYLFYRAAHHSKIFLLVVAVWLLAQSFISSTGFYTYTVSTPPRFALAVLPPLAVIALLFVLPAGRRFTDSLNARILTLLHIIRIPVELVLFWLFVYKTIPLVMTFEGRNLDILSGLTAPLLYYIVFVKKWAGTTALLVWNIICLGLLVNIVVTALLSAPFPFQQLAFNQPNIAILYFPFVWLPCCIVPLVLYAHLATVRGLLRNKTAAATPTVAHGV